VEIGDEEIWTWHLHLNSLHQAPDTGLGFGLGL